MSINPSLKLSDFRVGVPQGHGGRRMVKMLLTRVEFPPEASHISGKIDQLNLDREVAASRRAGRCDDCGDRGSEPLADFGFVFRIGHNLGTPS